MTATQDSGLDRGPARPVARPDASRDGQRECAWMHRTRCFCRVAVVSRRPSRVSCSVRLFLVGSGDRTHNPNRPARRRARAAACVGGAPAQGGPWPRPASPSVTSGCGPQPDRGRTALRRADAGGRGGGRGRGAGGDGIIRSMSPKTTDQRAEPLLVTSHSTCAYNSHCSPYAACRSTARRRTGRLGGSRAARPRHDSHVKTH